MAEQGVNGTIVGGLVAKMRCNNCAIANIIVGIGCNKVDAVDPTFVGFRDDLNLQTRGFKCIMGVEGCHMKRILNIRHVWQVYQHPPRRGKAGETVNVVVSDVLTLYARRPNYPVRAVCIEQSAFDLFAGQVWIARGLNP